jgi:hypothetical protein
MVYDLVALTPATLYYITTHQVDPIRFRAILKDDHKFYKGGDMIEGALKLRSIDEIVDEMTESYMLGEYLEGVTSDGDDALMSPKRFAERFHSVCMGFGYREAEIIPAKMEIEEWCREHLLHLESKFR